MMSERGLLVSQRGRRGVVLTADGEFRSTWLVGGRREIGEEVPVASLTLKSRWAAVVAAVLVVLSGGWLGVQQLLAAPVAWVSVDINPSLRLGVDNQGEVQGAVALDADGQRVLKDLRFERQPLGQVVASVTALAKQDGFLQPGKPAAVLITVTPLRRLSPQVTRAIAASDEAVREFAQRQRLQLTVQELHLSRQEMAAAARQGVTPARWALRQRLAERGLGLSVQRVRQESLYNLLKATQAGARATVRAQGEAPGAAVSAAVTSTVHGGSGPAVRPGPGHQPSKKLPHPGLGLGYRKKETQEPPVGTGIAAGVYSHTYDGAYGGEGEGPQAEGVNTGREGTEPSGDNGQTERHDGRGGLPQEKGGRLGEQ